MEEALRNYVQENLLNTPAGTQLELDDDLLGGGMIDSLGMMNLIAHIEEVYALTVPPEDMTIEHFQSIEVICTYIQERKVAS
ncbi:MAG: acyl carrier protein [Bacteroidota bacterium]